MSMAEALTQITEMVTTAVNIITGNPVLMVTFCGGLMGIAFKIIGQAKRSAK